jgi:hypothetical protein
MVAQEPAVGGHHRCISVHRPDVRALGEAADDAFDGVARE